VFIVSDEVHRVCIHDIAVRRRSRVAASAPPHEQARMPAWPRSAEQAGSIILRATLTQPCAGLHVAPWTMR
jgi:hypothetical protein